MNKVVFIGDIHGHDTWKHIIANEHDADHFVFVGDYFDAFVITPAVQIHNFKEIIEFKEANPDRVTLLIGNHDYHYTPHCTGRYGGWSAWHAVEIGELLKENKDHLQVAWQQDNVLATHAGVSSTWYNEHAGYANMFEIADTLNLLWSERPDYFNHSGRNSFGNSPYDGPFWIRPEALKSDLVDPDIIQIVGHTQRETISSFSNGKRIAGSDNVFVIDTLPREYLILEDDEFITANVYSN